jgi:hypothetical protein
MAETRVRIPVAVLRSALAASASILLLGFWAAPGAAARIAPSGLPYSSASASVVQRQPPPGACRPAGGGLYERPDMRCTPGAVNPAVTQASIYETICRSGWTSSVRPRVAITEPEKLASMGAYGAGGRASSYEYDHLVPLELGGAVNDARNLWPEPDYASSFGFYKNPKDRLENALHRLVCDGILPLSQAQRLIASNWVVAYRKYL